MCFTELYRANFDPDALLSGFFFFLLCKVQYLYFTLKAKDVLGKADTYIQVTALDFRLFPKS